MDQDNLFETALSHYCKKIHELSDEIQILKYKLRLARTLVDENWKGLSGEACNRQLESGNTALGQAESKLSDAVNALTGIELEE